MTDRERLIELQRKAFREWKNSTIDTFPLEFITDYLLANGVIVPPCKVGDTVYIIDSDEYGDYPYVLDVKVSAVGREIGGIWATMDLPLGMKQSGYIGATDFGKTVFLTKEEAEQALKERDGNDG